MEKNAIRADREGWDESRVPADAIDFARYVALIASRITAGEADPAAVNWRYVRDRALSAIAVAEKGR